MQNFYFLTTHTQLQNHKHINMEPTIILPSCEQFLKGCLLTSTTTDEEPCSICLEEYEVAPTVTVTGVEQESHLWHTLCQTPSCGHKFGFSCLFTWAKEHNTCPMCRQEMYQQEEEEETNRAMQEELMTDIDFGDLEEEEEDLAAYWTSLNIVNLAGGYAPSREIGLPEEDHDRGTLVQGGEDDCADVTHRLRRFNIGEDIQTVEEVEHWSTRAARVFEAF